MTYSQLKEILDGMTEDELSHPVTILSLENGVVHPTAILKTYADFTTSEDKWPDGQHVLVG